MRGVGQHPVGPGQHGRRVVDAQRVRRPPRERDRAEARATAGIEQARVARNEGEERVQLVDAEVEVPDRDLGAAPDLRRLRLPEGTHVLEGPLPPLTLPRHGPPFYR